MYINRYLFTYKSVYMFRYLSGVATGWMLARAPPTQEEIKAWVDYLFKSVKKLMPKDDQD